MAERQEPLQGSQRAAFDQAVEKACVEWVKRTELRKWAVIQALEMCRDRGPASPVGIAKEIYDFVRTE